MPRSVLTAILLFAAIVAYFGIRMLFADNGPDPQAAAAASTADADARAEVLVRPLVVEPHTVYTTLKGQTEPLRTVSVRAETAGTVTRTPVEEGATVSRGALLCQLDVESREIRVRQAQAELDARQLDYDAARTLAEDGLTPVNSAAAAKAAFDAAEANLEAARIELERTRLRAPFAGIFEHRDAEQGDYLAPGSPCGTIVDLDPLLVVVEATETQAAFLAEDQTATVDLIDGRAFEGTVRFVGKTADPATRTFRVEIEAPNPDAEISAGLTAAIRIATGDALATRLSPASLVLADNGNVGVRYIDASDMVQFAIVQIVDDAPDGIWVTGLPDGARLMLSGQDYIREGVRVIPIADEGL